METIKKHIDKLAIIFIDQIYSIFVIQNLEIMRVKKKIEDIVTLKPISEDEKKMFYDINFVAKRYKLNSSNLRFWEGSFPMLNPQKNRGGDRAYTNEDIELLDEIYDLVVIRKFTLPGAAQLIESKRQKTKLINSTIEKLEQVKSALQDMRFLLK